MKGGVAVSWEADKVGATRGSWEEEVVDEYDQNTL